MLELILFTPAFLGFQPTQRNNTYVPLHVAAESIAQQAMNSTVLQFNTACEQVCHEQQQAQ